MKHKFDPEFFLGQFTKWMPHEETRNIFDDENGMHEPDEFSVLKLRKNGSIDLFAKVNEGIRIDPNQHRILTTTHRIDQRASSIGLRADTKIRAEAIEQILIACEMDIELNAEGVLTLKGNEIRLEAPSIRLNSDTLQSTASRTVLSGSTVQIDATYVYGIEGGSGGGSGGVTRTPFTTNGVSKIFTVSASAESGTELVFLNGIILNPGNGKDYVFNQGILTLSELPGADEQVLVIFRG
jgi:hypothetical protein